MIDKYNMLFFLITNENTPQSIEKIIEQNLKLRQKGYLCETLLLPEIMLTRMQNKCEFCAARDIKKEDAKNIRCVKCEIMEYYTNWSPIFDPYAITRKLIDYSCLPKPKCEAEEFGYTRGYFHDQCISCSFSHDTPSWECTINKWFQPKICLLFTKDCLEYDFRQKKYFTSLKVSTLAFDFEERARGSKIKCYLYEDLIEDKETEVGDYYANR